MISKNQIIAQITYQQVAKFKESGDENLHKNYATIVHKLPAMILQNGLLQATGFLLSKAPSEKAHETLLNHLLDAFKQINEEFEGVEDGKAFHEHVIGSDLKQIMRYTREALEISGWLRRYVQGILKLGATGDSEEVTMAKEGEQ